MPMRCMHQKVTFLETIVYIFFSYDKVYCSRSIVLYCPTWDESNFITDDSLMNIIFTSFDCALLQNNRIL